eukprot:324098-Chlamydomonas_euryale.AAC.1
MCEGKGRGGLDGRALCISDMCDMFDIPARHIRHTGTWQGRELARQGIGQRRNGQVRELAGQGSGNGGNWQGRKLKE